MKILFTQKGILLLSLLVVSACSRAQAPFPLPPNGAVTNIVKAEYYFDTDPGFGKGTALPVTPGTNITISNSVIGITGLSGGVHHVYIRTEDANGHWSLTNSQVLFIVSLVAFPANPAPVNIVGAEYFFDADPGFGKGTVLPVTAGTNITISNAVINITGLSTGIHHVFIRTHDANGHWGLTNDQALFIVSVVALPANAALVNITGAEYFFDTDPGLGKGTALSVTPAINIAIGNAAINITALSTGIHRLYIRTRDANGHWSLTNEKNLAILVTSLIIPPNPTPGNITMLEYFFDTDPGFGKGHIVTVTGSANLVNFIFPVDVSSLSTGTHHLFVRTFDTWSATSVMSLSVSTALPITLVSFSAKIQPDNSVLLNWETTNETNNKYFGVERSEDGSDFTQIGEVKGSGTTGLVQDYSFNDPNPPLGMNYYRLRQVDIDGHFTFSPVVAVQIQSSIAFRILPNPVHDLLTVNIGGVPEDGGLFRIMDMSGKLLMEVNAMPNNTQQIDVSKFPSGPYILQYLTIKHTYTTRFLKF